MEGKITRYQYYYTRNQCPRRLETSDASRDARAEWYMMSWKFEVSIVFLRSSLAFSSVKQPRGNLDLGFLNWSGISVVALVLVSFLRLPEL